VPWEDIVINIQKSPIMWKDETTADVYIWVETNPGELETRADELRDALARLWSRLFTAKDYTAEVWVRFVPGSWCMVDSEGVVVDSVNYPGPAQE
jgi:hypothetical protein